MLPLHADLVELIARFAQSLRKAGVKASMPRVELMLEAVSVFHPPSLHDIYTSGRSTLCGSKEDIEKYECGFRDFFCGATEQDPTFANHNAYLVEAKTFAGWGYCSSEDSDKLDQGPSSMSAEEVLRHRDFADMDTHERNEVFDLIKFMRPHMPMRISRRLQPSKRGTIDIKRTVRAAASYGGDPDRLYRHRLRLRARQCVLLLDVSGSMTSYADPLLLFSYAAIKAAPASTEVFTIGTRLTRLTPSLRHADADTALQSASTVIPDWSGGTRLGDQLKAFLDRWGQRGMARGAVIVIASDGWERGDCALLKAQMQRLQRITHRIIWCNPHKSGPGYAPIAQGMRVAMPYLDEFVEGRTLAELENLAVTIGGGSAPSPRHASPDARSNIFRSQHRTIKDRKWIDDLVHS